MMLCEYVTFGLTLIVNIVLYKNLLSECRNSIEKNLLVWVVFSVSALFLIQEVLLWRGRQWSLERDLFLGIALSFLF